MKKYYHLSTCNTCQRILKDLGTLLAGFDEHEIKSTPITQNDMDEMKKRAGSYESLFSRRAIKFRSIRLAEKNLTEQDYSDLIIKEYTFLKRPVFIIDDQIFIGNSKSKIEHLKEVLARINKAY